MGINKSGNTYMQLNIKLMDDFQRMSLTGSHDPQVCTLKKENTRFVSFDIKFTRQGFENAC